MNRTERQIARHAAIAAQRHTPPAATPADFEAGTVIALAMATRTIVRAETRLANALRLARAERCHLARIIADTDTALARHQ